MFFNGYVESGDGTGPASRGSRRGIAVQSMPGALADGRPLLCSRQQRIRRSPSEGRSSDRPWREIARRVPTGAGATALHRSASTSGAVR